MKFTFRPVYAIVPAVALCALVVAAMATHTTPTHAQQDMQTSAHALQPHVLTTTISEDGANVYSCIPGGDTFCSILNQPEVGDTIQVQCQLQVGSGSNSAWWSKVTDSFDNTGWVNNAFIKGGPKAIGGVPTCSK